MSSTVIKGKIFYSNASNLTGEKEPLCSETSYINVNLGALIKYKQHNVLFMLVRYKLKI